MEGSIEEEEKIVDKIIEKCILFKICFAQDFFLQGGVPNPFDFFHNSFS